MPQIVCYYEFTVLDVGLRNVWLVCQTAGTSVSHLTWPLVRSLLPQTAVFQTEIDTSLTK